MNDKERALWELLSQLPVEEMSVEVQELYSDLCILFGNPKANRPLGVLKVKGTRRNG